MPGCPCRHDERWMPRRDDREHLPLCSARHWPTPGARRNPIPRASSSFVPYTPGSPNDVMARLLTQHSQPRLGQPIVIDNKPGGGTTIGTKAAAAAEPDGYTLLFVSSAIVIDPAMKQIDYDPLKDFAPVASVNTTAWLIAVSPSLPVKTLAEFVAYTKAHPGTINFAATQGTAAILVAERFKQLSGADISSSLTRAAPPPCPTSSAGASRC